MDVRRIIKALEDMAFNGPANLDTFVKASVLLAALEKRNNSVDVDAGEYRDGTVNEKIGQARGWFTEFCGLGNRDDFFTNSHQFRSWAYSALNIMGQHTTEEGKFNVYRHDPKE